MSAILLNRLSICLAASSSFLAGVVLLQASNKHDYPETGMVISATVDHGDVYNIETGDKIYKMACIAARMFQSTLTQCEISGKPIAVKDTVHFRIEDEDDEDVAYVADSGNHEEKLRILSIEMKALPPLPATTNPSVGESCAVLGRGMDLVDSQYSINLASPTAPLSVPPMDSGNSPVIPTGPVMAIPVTGGPPVQVISAGPVIGGVITGVPVTGGTPVTAISVGPVTGTPIGGTAPDNSVNANRNSTPSTTVNELERVHFLRVQTSGHVYKLACESKECWLEYRAPQLGDLLTIQIQEKSAYVSWRPPGRKGKQKFAILGVDDIAGPPAAPSH